MDRSDELPVAGRASGARSISLQRSDIRRVGRRSSRTVSADRDDRFGHADRADRGHRHQGVPTRGGPSDNGSSGGYSQNVSEYCCPTVDSDVRADLGDKPTGHRHRATSAAGHGPTGHIWAFPSGHAHPVPGIGPGRLHEIETDTRAVTPDRHGAE
ncbi:hypothetical protein GCM10027167_77820 [Nocardia heshunensis]